VQKRIDYFKNYQDEIEDQALLQTIKIPKNLLFLSDKLPQANYEKQVNKKNNSFTKKNVNDLPDIRMNAVISKIQTKKRVDEIIATPSEEKTAKKVSKESTIVSADKNRPSNVEESKRDISKRQNREEAKDASKDTSQRADSRSKRLKNMPIIYDIPIVKPVKKKNE
jgi:hypothetical protein